MLFRMALFLAFFMVVASPSIVRAQAGGRRHETAARKGRLLPNQPNPVAGETLIPFRVGADSCVTAGERHVVSLRIFNILSQVVAVPLLIDSAASADSVARGDSSVIAPARPLTNVELECGSYVARWNGRRDADGRRASPGVYMYQLVVDGHPSGMRKMVVSR